MAVTLMLADWPVGLTQDDFLSDEAWLRVAETTAPGASYRPSRIEIDASRRLKALGFVSQDGGHFTREANLDEPAALVHRVGARLRHIDAVAVMTIDRGEGGRPYLYDTLQSLLRELPDETIINIVVGDERDGYVARHRLIELYGPAQAARLHVISTPQATAAFLRNNYDLGARASWNYARILRGFSGPNHLLVFEDDVLVSEGMSERLDTMLSTEHPPLLSLYNYHCGRLPGADPNHLSEVRIVSYPARAIDRGFGRSQAIVFTAAMAQALGNHIALRLGNDPFDTMMGQYMRIYDLPVGFVQPSMVQHMGYLASGLGPFHQSVCFAPVYPRSEARAP